MFPKESKDYKLSFDNVAAAKSVSQSPNMKAANQYLSESFTIEPEF